MQHIYAQRCIFLTVTIMKNVNQMMKAMYPGHTKPLRIPQPRSRIDRTADTPHVAGIPY